MNYLHSFSVSTRESHLGQGIPRVLPSKHSVGRGGVQHTADGFLAAHDEVVDDVCVLMKEEKKDRGR